jgi:Cu(I)/Ag(I) efflux system membrane protein CusA/SilA
VIAHLIRWSVRNRFFVLIAMLALVGAGLWAARCAARSVRRAGHRARHVSRAGAADRREPGHVSAHDHDDVGARREDGARLLVLRRRFVYVLFEDGTDLYWARSRVLEYLNQVQSRLPPGAKASLGPDATGSAGSTNTRSSTAPGGTISANCARCRTGSCATN